MVAAAVEPERLLFVDECGVHTSLAPIYGYAPRDERIHLPVPRNRGKNTTLLSSMTLDGMGPSLAVEGATTARVFETYVEKVLVPSLRAGQVVMMDNLSAHRPKRIRELIEQQGCELLYLPAYSPDYKWDEKAEIMLRAEPTMPSVEDRRPKADPHEGGLWSHVPAPQRYRRHRHRRSLQPSLFAGY